jgi:hypothetical protein
VRKGKRRRKREDEKKKGQRVGRGREEGRETQGKEDEEGERS